MKHCLSSRAYAVASLPLNPPKNKRPGSNSRFCQMVIFAYECALECSNRFQIGTILSQIAADRILQIHPVQHLGRSYIDDDSSFAPMNEHAIPR